MASDVGLITIVVLSDEGFSLSVVSKTRAKIIYVIPTLVELGKVVHIIVLNGLECVGSNNKGCEGAIFHN